MRGDWQPGFTLAREVQSGLLTALEATTPDTYDHVRRVAESAAALAKAMCLSNSDVREVRHAALFHDIGKIAIPSHVLGRSGPLSEDEMSVLRMHVTIGAELLSDERYKPLRQYPHLDEDVAASGLTHPPVPG